MPSNKDLTDAILKLDPKADVDGLNNLKLESLLSALKAPAPASDPVVSPSSEPAPSVDHAAEAARTSDDAEAKRQAKLKAESEAEAKKQAAANAAEEAVRSGGATHKVAEGRSVMCLRGVVPDFTGDDRVSAKDFGQGKADLDRLAADGVLVKL
jgi:hypothetical protein